VSSLLSFDRVADIYDDTRGLPKEIMELLIKEMSKSLKGSKLVLDLGVGTGRFAKPLLDRGFRIVGVDISRLMMKRAREKGVVDLMVAEAHNLPFIDRAFDSTVIVHFLHLVSDWRMVVREIGRVTRKTIVSNVRTNVGPNLRDLYLEARESLGYPVNGLKFGERSLSQVIKPKKIKRVSERQVEINVTEDLEYLRGKSSSITWDLAEDVHRKVLEKVQLGLQKMGTAGREIEEIVSWDAPQFRLVNAT
jgi:SAM-dependent methyltransferase